MLGKLEQAKSSGSLLRKDVVKYFDYIKQVAAEFAEFEKAKEDATLFGSQTALNDLQRAPPSFSVVPVSREEFQAIADPVFLRLLATLGANVRRHGQVYPRIDKVSPKTFLENILYIESLFLQKMGYADGVEAAAVDLEQEVNKFALDAEPMELE